MRSILNYIGKITQQEIDKIGHLIPSDTTVYVEPFAGSYNCGLSIMDNIYINKTVLNDKDREVYNFWTQIKENPDTLYENIIQYQRYLYNQLTDTTINSEILALIKELKTQEKENKSKQAALEFLYRNNFKFFNKRSKALSEIKFTEDELYETSIRLLHTDITNDNYSLTFEKYDSPTTFFLIDPPYNVKHVAEFYNEAIDFNHEALRNTINTLQGTCLIRYNDDTYTNYLYKDYKKVFTNEKIIMGRIYREHYFTNKNQEETHEKHKRH